MATLNISRSVYNKAYVACASSETLEEALNDCPYSTEKKRDQYERLVLYVWRKYKP